MATKRILLIFIDGLGLGPSDSHRNPLLAHPDIWPTFQTSPTGLGLGWKPLDACLGVEGLPQSATGQTALLTGVNAPKILGKHLQGFPSKPLIAILEEQSIFVQLKKRGLEGTFANAYRHPDDITPATRLSVTSHALKASGQPFRSLEQLQRGEALTHDFTNRLLVEKGYQVPIFTPDRAAEILVNLAKNYPFTLYEHFLTDVLAHRGEASEIAAHVAALSDFIRATLRRAEAANLTLIITSDHGNLEDHSVRTHTRNPVPLLWKSPAPVAANQLPIDIAGVTPWILKMLAGDTI